MKKKNSKKISWSDKPVNYRYICDFRGFPINPGNVIVAGVYGGPKTMYARLVKAIGETRLHFGNGGYTQLSDDELQEHIIVIEDPLFAVENPQIKNLLEQADKLRGNIFPIDYKLGKSIIEFKEEKKISFEDDL